MSLIAATKRSSSWLTNSTMRVLLSIRFVFVPKRCAMRPLESPPKRLRRLE